MSVRAIRLCLQACCVAVAVRSVAARPRKNSPARARHSAQRSAGSILNRIANHRFWAMALSGWCPRWITTCPRWITHGPTWLSKSMWRHHSIQRCCAQRRRSSSKWALSSKMPTILRWRASSRGVHLSQNLPCYFQGFQKDHYRHGCLCRCTAAPPYRKNSCREEAAI